MLRYVQELVSGRNESTYSKCNVCWYTKQVCVCVCVCVCVVVVVVVRQQSQVVRASAW